VADVFVEENTLRGIANAIRSKNGSSATYFPAEMEQAIRDLLIPDVSALNATAADILAPKVAFTADGETEGTIPTKSASDVTVSGDTVSAPAGYYPNAVSKSVQSGSATTPATIIPANPTISVNNSTGLVTASVNKTQAITPTVSEGYVSAGTPGNVRAFGSATSQLTTQGAATITPTQSQQTAVAAGKFTTGDVVVDPIPSEYIVPTGTKQITITANGTTTEDVTNYASAQITANVPNTYTSSDEGKVVSNGALVAQGSDTVTANDTYDTTLINSLTVNVSGGGQIATGTITLAADTVGNNMPTIDVGFDYSHILVFPNATHVGYGSRSSGLILYWTDGTNSYAAGVTTNSGGSTSSGGAVSVKDGGSALVGVIGQKVGNTFVFAGTSTWNGYFRAALTWTWVAW